MTEETRNPEEAAAELEVAAAMTAMDGLEDMTDAVDMMNAAEDAAAVAAVAEAAAVEDLTRAVDAEIVAARVGQLS
jgi:hypothetical protein